MQRPYETAVTVCAEGLLHSADAGVNRCWLSRNKAGEESDQNHGPRLT